MECYDYAESLKKIGKNVYEVTAFDPEVYFCYNTFMELMIKRFGRRMDSIRVSFEGKPVDRMKIYIRHDPYWGEGFGEIIDGVHQEVEETPLCNCDVSDREHHHIRLLPFIFSYLLNPEMEVCSMLDGTLLDFPADWVDFCAIKTIEHLQSIEEILDECNRVQHKQKIYYFDEMEVDYHDGETMNAILDRKDVICITPRY